MRTDDALPHRDRLLRAIGRLGRRQGAEFPRALVGEAAVPDGRTRSAADAADREIFTEDAAAGGPAADEAGCGRQQFREPAACPLGAAISRTGAGKTNGDGDTKNSV